VADVKCGLYEINKNNRANAMRRPSPVKNVPGPNRSDVGPVRSRNWTCTNATRRWHSIPDSHSDTVSAIKMGIKLCTAGSTLWTDMHEITASVSMGYLYRLASSILVLGGIVNIDGVIW